MSDTLTTQGVNSVDTKTVDELYPIESKIYDRLGDSVLEMVSEITPEESEYLRQFNFRLVKLAGDAEEVKKLLDENENESIKELKEKREESVRENLSKYRDEIIPVMHLVLNHYKLIGDLAESGAIERINQITLKELSEQLRKGDILESQLSELEKMVEPIESDTSLDGDNKTLTTGMEHSNLELTDDELIAKGVKAGKLHQKFLEFETRNNESCDEDDESVGVGRMCEDKEEDMSETIETEFYQLPRDMDALIETLDELIERRTDLNYTVEEIFTRYKSVFMKWEPKKTVIELFSTVFIKNKFEFPLEYTIMEEENNILALGWPDYGVYGYLHTSGEFTLVVEEIDDLVDPIINYRGMESVLEPHLDAMDNSLVYERFEDSIRTIADYASSPDDDENCHVGGQWETDL